MLPSAIARVESLADDAVVLDVGGWASPLARADWVIDLMPYASRGLYGSAPAGDERFSEETWVVRDICDREPWPFEDGRFDFAVCSHTLEDIRDPVWVCSEIIRVARAGYVEVPSRLEEQSWGVHGDWIGWSHHRWLTDVEEGRIEFVHKPHMLSGRPDCTFSGEFGAALTAEQRVRSFFWSGSFEFGERIFIDFKEFDEYLESFVRENRSAAAAAEARAARRWLPGRNRS